MPLSVEALYAPTAVVRQLREQSPFEEYEVPGVIPFGFIRRSRWKTIVEFHDDQSFEAMPQQLLRIHEFVISKEDWTQNDIVALEAHFDRCKGSAYPFLFVAPDDGETYQVRFKSDALEITFYSAGYRKVDLVFVECGDLDNSVNTGLVYPSYVESTTTTSSTTGSTTDTITLPGGGVVTAEPAEEGTTTT